MKKTFRIKITFNKKICICILLSIVFTLIACMLPNYDLASYMLGMLFGIAYLVMSKLID